MKKTILFSFFTLFLTFFSIEGFAQDTLWWTGLGSDTNWTNSDNWSTTDPTISVTTSLSPPSAANDVVFNAGSFPNMQAYTITINSAVQARDFTFDSVGNATSVTINGSGAFSIFGGVKLLSTSTGLNYNHSGGITFKASTTGHSLDFSDQFVPSHVTFDGLGGGWIFNSGLTVSGNKDLTVIRGEINFNSQTFTIWYNFKAITGNTDRSLIFGNSTFHLLHRFWQVSGNFTELSGNPSVSLRRVNAGVTFSHLSTTSHSLNYASVTLPNTTAATIAIDNDIKIDNYTGESIVLQPGIVRRMKFGTVNLEYGYTSNFARNIMEVDQLNFTGSSCDKHKIISRSYPTAVIDFTSHPGSFDRLWLEGIIARVNGVAASPNIVVNSGNDDGGNQNWTINVSTTARDLYWIGNSGNWQDPTNWSLSSGGAPLAGGGVDCAPTIDDNVFFDANSFNADNQAMHIDAFAYCKNMTWNGLDQTEIDWTGAANMFVRGDLTLDKNMKQEISYNQTIILGDQVDGQINFQNGADNRGMPNAVFSFDTGAKINQVSDKVYIKQIVMSHDAGRSYNIGGNNRELRIGSGGVAFGGTINMEDATIVNEASGTAVSRNIKKLIYNSNSVWRAEATSGFRHDRANNTFPTFIQTNPGVNFTIDGNGTNAAFSVDGDCTINGRFITGAGGVNVTGTLTLSDDTHTFRGGLPVTLGGLDAAGTGCSSAPTIRSHNGAQFNLNTPNNTTDTKLNFATISDVNYTGDANPLDLTGQGVVDGGNNTNVTVGAAVAQTFYWRPNPDDNSYTGNWNDPKYWALSKSADFGQAAGGCTPTALDSIVFDNKSANGTAMTVTLNDLQSARAIEWVESGPEAVPANMTLDVQNGAVLNIKNRFRLASQMSTTWGTATTMNFSNTDSVFVNLKGKDVNGNINFQNGKVVLEDDIAGAAHITLENGEFYSKEHVITAGTFWVTGASSKKVDLTNTTVTLSNFKNTGGNNAPRSSWRIEIGSSVDLITEGSTIEIRALNTFNGAGGNFFYGGGKTYNDVLFTSPGTAQSGIYEIIDSDTFAGTLTVEGNLHTNVSFSVNFLNLKTDRNHNFKSGETTTILPDGNLEKNGDLNAFLNMQSSVNGSLHNFVKASGGNVFVCNLNILDIQATGVPFKTNNVSTYNGLAGAAASPPAGTTWDFTAASTPAQITMTDATDLHHNIGDDVNVGYQITLNNTGPYQMEFLTPSGTVQQDDLSDGNTTNGVFVFEATQTTDVEIDAFRYFDCPGGYNNGTVVDDITPIKVPSISGKALAGNNDTETYTFTNVPRYVLVMNGGDRSNQAAFESRLPQLAIRDGVNASDTDNLGDVTVTTHIDGTSINIDPFLLLTRRWNITTAGINGKARIRFYISQTELETLKTLANKAANTNLEFLGSLSLYKFGAGVTPTSSDNFVQESRLTSGVASEISATTYYYEAEVESIQGSFALGTAIAPGGVASSIKLWVRSDDGVTTSGNEVTKWEDKSGSGAEFVNTGLATGINGGPTLSTDPDHMLSYQPVLTFDGTQGLIESTKNVLEPNNLLTIWMITTGTAGGTSLGHEADLVLPLEGVNPRFTIDGSIEQQTKAGATETIGGGLDVSVPSLIVAKRNDIGSLNWQLTNYRNGSLVNTVNFNGDLEDVLVRMSLGYRHKTDDTAENALTGHIAEIVLYGSVLAGLDDLKVASYLAGKHGITLTHDYVMSDSSIVFDTDGAFSTYANNIIMIGRDDQSQLDQRQAKSVNAGTILRMGRGNIEATNAANTTPFAADFQFTFVGTDSNPATPTEFESGNFCEKLQRTWRVSELGVGGDPGNVVLEFEMSDTGLLGNSTSDFMLLIKNSDADFTSGTTMVVPDSYTNGILRFNSINLAHGDHFTIASSAMSPGFVSEDLQLWLKADSGVTLAGSKVSQWDNTAHPGNLTARDLTGSEEVTVSSGSLNFNDELVFPGGAYLESTEQFIGNNNAYTKFVVFRRDVSTLPNALVASAGTDNTQSIHGFYYQPDLGQPNANDLRGFHGSNNGSTGGDIISSTSAGELNRYYIAALRYGAGGPESNMLRINSEASATTNTTVQNFNDLGTQIGADQGGGLANNTLQGRIAEVIIYNRALADTEMKRVESYLAIKYGLTLENSYLSSDGTEIYDTSNGFGSHIAGIAREDCQGLSQYKSKSQEKGAVVTSGNGDIAVPTALANNNSFFLWGNNNGLASWTSTGAPSAFQILERQWKIQETGTVGGVKLQFDVANSDFDIPSLLGGSTYYLIYDSNGNQDLSDDTPVVLSNVSGSLWETTSAIDFANGTLFTLASTFIDTDNDGVENTTDLDDDNDGILDTIESGGVDPTTDADADNVPLYLDDDDGNDAIGNANGIVESAFDADGDNVANHLDLDSDNDGIPDNVEAQATASYTIPTTTSAAEYITNNGVNNAYLTTNGGGPGLAPVDTDGNSGENLPDYLDSDSDDDTILDIAENGDSDNSIGSFADADGDGIDDLFDTVSNLTVWDVNEAVSTGTIADLQSVFGDLDSDASPTPTPLTNDLSFRDDCQVVAGVIEAAQSICFGDDPVAFTVNTAAIGDGIVSYQWQISTTSASAGFTNIAGAQSAGYDHGVLTQTTWFRRMDTNTLNGKTCSVFTNALEVTITALPDAGSNGALTICEGETVTAAQLFAELGGTPDTGGTWSPALAGAGTYTYTVAATSPCTVDATAIVVVTEQPLPDAGSNGTLTICEGETVTAAQLFAELGGTPDTGGTWSPTLAGAGTYTYTVSATSPCTTDATATVVVTEQALPDAGTNGTLEICEGETVTAAQLFAELGGTPDTGGTWSPALAGAGTYTYTVSATSPCTTDTTATVVVTEQPLPDAGTNGALEICEGETVTEAQLFAELGGTPDTGGTWSPALAGAGTYTYTVSATSPCTTDATATVVVTEIQEADAGSNGTLTICEGETVTTAQLFAELGGTPDTGGTWSPALAGAGTYTYTVSATSPCTTDATATVVVTEQPLPDAGTNGTLTICEGETVNTAQLFAQLGGTPDKDGTWSPALAGAGTYTYTVSATSPCTTDATATVVVTEEPLPNAGTNGTLTICEGEKVTAAQLFAELGGTPDTGGTWSPALAGAGTYTYTVAATSPCTVDATATVVVTEQPLPDAGTNGTLTICEGETVTEAQLFAELGGTPDTGGTWSPTLAGAGTYTYTVSATSPCTTDATATVVVTEQPLPDAGSNGTLTICEGETVTAAQLFAQLGGTPDTGGTWSPTLAGAGTYTYTVSATSPCTTDATATVVVTEQPLPDAGSNGALTICEGETVTEAQLFAELGGTPDTGGTWSPALAGAGTYTYTVAATSPCTVDATATVVVTEEPLPDAGTNGTLTICEGETVTATQLFAELGGTPDTGGTWSPALAGAGTYTYTVAATSPCTIDATATVVVTEQPLPDAGSNGTLTICEGETVTAAQLFAELGGTPDAGGIWSPALAGAGTYTYTVAATSPCTTDATATVVVTEQPLPDAGTNGTLTICEGETVTAAQLFEELGGTPDTGGTWSPTLAGAGTYTYTVAATSPCTTDATATVVVTEQPLPDAGTNGTLTICEGETVTAAQLFAELGGTPDTGGTWSPTLAGAGTYTYTVAATSPCAVDATATVVVTEQALPDAGTNGTLEICEGDTVTETQLFAQLGGTPDTGGTWSPTLAGAGTYTYTVSATSPCTTDATATVVVTEQPLPDAGSNGTLTICEGETVTAAQLFAELGGTPDTGGTWSPALAGAGTYTYTVAATSPCTTDATATVVVTEQPLPDAGSNGTLTICEGETVTETQLLAQLGGTPDIGGTWSPALAGAGTYTYTVAATSPCTTDAIATVVVTEIPEADAGTSGTLEICEGETVTEAQLFAQLGGTPDTGGIWSPALAGAGTYTYTVSATSPCTTDAMATVVVTESAAPDAGINGTLEVCEGETVTEAQLFAQLGGTPDTGGTWSPTVVGAGTYTYTVTAINPCTTDATATVVVTEQLKPNAGVGSTIEICPEATVTEAELFGALSGSPDAGGTWSPALAGPGTYTYTVAATSPCTVNATAEVIVTTTPYAGSSGTLTICPGTTVTETQLFAALGNDPDTGGTWSPTLAGAGTYTYTLIPSPSCGTGTTSVVVVTEGVAPNAGTNGTLEICEGETVTANQLFAQLGGTPDGGGTWSPALAGAGTYTYTVAAMSPCTVDATAQIVVTETPQADAGSNGTLEICEGETVTAAQLFAELGGTPDTDGTWSPALAGAGTYTYTVAATSPCTTDATAQVVVTEQAQPDAGVNSTLTICEGETVTAAQLFAQLGGTPDTGGTWSPALAGAGAYTYTVSATSPCTVDATATVVVTEQPLPDAGTNGILEICEGETVTASQLFAQLGGTPDAGGTWSPAIVGAGTYTYTVAATSPCTAAATATVVVTEQPLPDAGTGGALEICEGETITAAQLFAVLGGTPDTGGTWSPALAGAGTYTYTVAATSPCAVDATTTVVVTEQPLPDAGSNGTLTICEGETVTEAQLFAELVGTPDTGGTWSPALAGAGTYTYTVAATSPCTTDATTTVVVTEQPLPDAGSNGTLTICEGETVTEAQLFAELGGTPDTGGTWSPALAGAGTYTYTVAATSPCTTNATATVVVTEQALPDAGTGGTLTICEGETVTAAQLFAELGGTPDTGGTWSPALAGAGTYTYTVTATSPCAVDAIATVVVTEQAQPDAGSNGTLEICEVETITEAQLFAQLGGTPDTGGTWSPALAGAGTYTYTVSATSPCTTDATATVVVTEQAQPDAGTSGTLEICEGETVTEAQLFAELGGTPDTGGTWSPTLAGAGTYTYTVAATSPCATDATTQIVVTETIEADAGTSGTLEICEGETVTAAQLFAELGGTPDTGGTWSPALAGAGTYTYTVTATSPCTTDAMATIVVTENAAPDAGVNGTLEICEGETVTEAQLFAQLGGTPDAGGTWSPTVVGAGTYTYTVAATSPCTADAIATVVVTEQLKPNAGVGSTIEICPEATVTEAELFGALSGSPDTGGTWSPTLAGPGTYTYTVAATSPCTTPSTAEVIVTTTPYAGSNGTLTICPGTTVTEAQLFAALGNDPDTGGTWSPALAGAGTYTYTLIPSPSCGTGTTSVVVVTEGAAPNAGMSGTLEICEGEMVTENQLFAQLGGTPDGGGTWSPALAGAGTYTYTVAAISPCTIDATATIVVTETLQADAGTNGTLEICEGETVTEAQLFAELGGTPDTGGTWSPNLAGAGTYTYTVAATSPCTTDATAQVIVTEQAQPDAGVNGTLTICEGETVSTAQLFAQLGGTPDTGGTWSPTLAGAGTYTYTVAATNPCTVDATATVVVTEQAQPDAGTNGALEICEGETVTETQLFAMLGGTPDAGGTWSPAVVGAGTYTYTVAATSPCTVDATATVVVTEQVQPDAGTNGTLEICEGETVTEAQLFAELGGTPDTGGTWSPALAGAGTYTYTVVATSPCTTNATTTVVVTEQPLPNAGTSGTLEICEGETITETQLFAQLGGTPDAGGTWSPTVVGAGTYTYTVAATGPCTTDATATVVVTEQPLPDAGTNGTLEICEGEMVTATQLFAQLGGTPDTGGTWSPVLAGAGTYTYTVAATSPCTTDATATVVVTEQPLPDAGTSGTLDICEGETVTEAQLFAQLGGTPDTGGTWSPVLAGAGIYTYTVSATSPCTVDTTATVVVTEQPLPDAGTNGTLEICEGDTVTETQLFAQLGGTPDTGGTWSPALAGAGTYTYTVSATSPCAVDATATVVVTEESLPDAGTSGTLEICEGETVTEAQLFAQLGGTPDSGGTWSPALTGAGTYTYTVAATSPCTTDATATVVVTEQPLPDAGTSGTLEICEGETVTETQLFAQLGGTPDTGGTWSPALAGAGTYTYMVSATSPCTVDATATVVVTETPQADAGISGLLEICEGETITEAQLFAELGGTPDTGGTWSPVLAGAGTYTYTVAATSPCTTDATATVVVTETPQADAGISGTLEICEGETVTEAQLFAELGGTPDTGGTWSPTVVGAGTYTYTVSATSPCTTDATATIVVTETPQADAGTDGTLEICEGDIVTEAQLFAQLGGTPDTGGTWSPTLAGAGTYTYTVSATSPCTVDATAIVIVTEQAQPDAGTNGTLTIAFAATVTEAELFGALGGTPDTGGTWSPTLAGPGTYTYTVTATSPCTTDATAQVVVMEESDPLDSDGDGIPDVIDYDDDNDGITDVEEENGDPNLDTDGDGIVDRLDLDSDGDTVKDVYESGADISGLNISSEGRIIGNVGTDGIPDGVQAQGNFNSGEVQYSTLDTDADTKHNFQDTDDDNDGISTKDEDANRNGDSIDDDNDGDGIPNYLDVDDPGTSVEVIPNGFSPNGDGLNDRFVIPLLRDYPDFTIEIYNRWKDIVYSYKNNGRTGTDIQWWDGYSDGRLTVNPGQPVPAGTYFYVIRFNKDNRKPISGWVYVNR